MDLSGYSSIIRTFNSFLFKTKSRNFFDIPESLLKSSVTYQRVGPMVSHYLLFEQLNKIKPNPNQSQRWNVAETPPSICFLGGDLSRFRALEFMLGQCFALNSDKTIFIQGHIGLKLLTSYNNHFRTTLEESNQPIDFLFQEMRLRELEDEWSDKKRGKLANIVFSLAIKDTRPELVRIGLNSADLNKKDTTTFKLKKLIENGRRFGISVMLCWDASETELDFDSCFDNYVASVNSFENIGIDPTLFKRQIKTDQLLDVPAFGDLEWAEVFEKKAKPFDLSHKLLSFSLPHDVNEEQKSILKMMNLQCKLNLTSAFDRELRMIYESANK
jgi:hypothetical protein